MAREQKDNSGTIFKNDRKEKDTHPDRTGSALIDGVEYWISGWIKNGQNGQFLSLAFKRKDQQPQHQTIFQRAQAKVYPPDRITTGRDLPRKQSIIPDADSDVPF